MKKYFDKNNFALSSFDEKMKKQSLVVSCLLILFFIVSSFTFFNAFYAFVDVIGSIVSGSPDVAIYDLLRSVPLILSVFMSIWTLLLLQASFRKVNDEKWHKSLFKDAICLIVFGAVNVIYIIAALISGIYLSFVEGSPSPLFPLDAALYSALFIAIGAVLILYIKKFEKDFPFTAPGRSDIVTKARGAYCTFVSFWLLIALFGLSAGIYTIFIYDFTD